MSSSQPRSDSPKPRSDNWVDAEIVLEERDPPLDPQQREQLLREQRRYREKLFDGRCSISPENLRKLRTAAERLGMSEGDLICAGLDLMLQRHRDKLGDLLNPQPPSDEPKPQTEPPST